MKSTHRPAATSHTRLGWLVPAALAVGAVSAAALSAGTAGAASGNQVTVSVKTFGNNKVLIANGKPLYFLKQPSAVSCGSGCLKVWPALTLPASVSGAAAGKGVQSAKLGTTTGPNGLMQVTYAGQPVYSFAYDNVRGKVKGNITDKWGKWTDVVVVKGSSGSSSGSSGNSGGSSAGSGGAGF
jgi:predicted lipoprotein with Yx(FWY)xxD motif